MAHSLEELIRERAYHIWNANGRIDGRDDQYWLQAEREVLAELAGGATAELPAVEPGVEVIAAAAPAETAPARATAPEAAKTPIKSAARTTAKPAAKAPAKTVSAKTVSAKTVDVPKAPKAPKKAARLAAKAKAAAAKRTAERVVPPDAPDAVEAAQAALAALAPASSSVVVLTKPGTDAAAAPKPAARPKLRASR